MARTFTWPRQNSLQLESVLGRLPSPAEYLEYAKQLDSMSSEIYRYMNFDQIESFHNAAEEGKLIAAEQIVEVS